LVEHVTILITGLILVYIEAIDVALSLVSDRLARHTHALSSSIVPCVAVQMAIVRVVVVLVASEEETRLLMWLFL